MGSRFFYCIGLRAEAFRAEAFIEPATRFKSYGCRRPNAAEPGVGAGGMSGQQVHSFA
jgi:hypothetical protein